MKKLVAIVAFAIASASAAVSAPIGFDVRPAQPGGSNQIYQLGNGNYLGLWGVSGGALAQVGNTLTTSDLIDDFGVNKASIVDFYYAQPILGGAWAGNPSNFEKFGAAFQISSTSNGGDKLFDSFWVEWTGGNLFNAGGNSNMPASATLQGDPLAPVPVPAALPLLLGGLGGLVMVRRRKTAA